MKSVDDDYVEELNSSGPRISIATLMAFLPLISAVWIFVWQVFTYLRQGNWIPFSLLDGLAWLKVPWAVTPTDWLGLHNLLNQVHVSIGLLLLSIFLAWTLSD